MMILFLLLLIPMCVLPSSGQEALPSHMVNPLIGTDGHGHTYPGAALPFGMVQLSPDTRVEGWDACAGYHYSDTTILGFSHLHLSGTGIPDYGDILLTPFSGSRTLQEAQAPAPFSHEEESASPGYYRVMLKDRRIVAELTATDRVGIHRYTSAGTDSLGIAVDLVHGLGPDRVIEARLDVVGATEISGHRWSSGWAKDQQVYFVARFSRPLLTARLFSGDQLPEGGRGIVGTNVKGVFLFAPSADPLVVRVGLSFVSVEGARRNLEAETPDSDFDAFRKEAERAWDAQLGVISIEGGTPEQQTVFYTALYHMMLAPNIAVDVDGRYRGMDLAVHQADGFVPYTVFSLWDTFRAEHPFLSIIDRRRTADFVRTMLDGYSRSGVLPVWELAGNETWTMIGYHAVPVIVDAYVKGIRDFDHSVAFAAMKHSAMIDHQGLSSYREFGYIPADHEGESVSRTLEYAYDDWCISRMAGELGMDADAELFRQRAASYRNLFDPTTRLMRPKANATWVEPFDPTEVTFHYTEANPWQYSFFAPHDPGGLIRLMGGNERFVQRLDSLFQARPLLTGRQQPDITGLIGQYAHGNEPSHHVAYLYDYAGYAWKTQARVRQIMDSLYTDRPDGLCGNEDCGQMSAWYVMSALGFYQVCPGNPQYALGSPLFPKATIALESGRRFVIEAPAASSDAPYVQSVTLNGVRLERPFLLHEDLAKGGVLRFTMGLDPVTSPSRVEWPEIESGPPPPAFQAHGSLFDDSLVVAVVCADPEARIFLTRDGAEPDSSSDQYQGPFILKESTTLRAVALGGNGSSSPSARGGFVRFVPVGTLRLLSAYSTQYTGGGDQALIDSKRGREDWRLGAWQGYEGVDLEAVLDLGRTKTIRRVSLGCLQDQNAWIFLPSEVRFAFSDDGIRFIDDVIISHTVAPDPDGAVIHEFSAGPEDVACRYIRVEARNIGVCADWHKGAGGKAWLFVDELMVAADE